MANSIKPVFKRDEVRETFRTAVLSALDGAAREVFAAAGTAPGATDGDLPALFRIIDAHVEKLAERHGAVLADDPMGRTICHLMLAGMTLDDARRWAREGR